MIETRTGDLLRVEADALVNTVNCVGVMGRGIALQFKKAFPENYKAYTAACKRNEVEPGRMLVYQSGIFAPRFIINFPTKRHWKANSRIEDIEAGLRDLVRVVQEEHIQSIALPPLGCGLGGLDWSEVRPKIESAFAELPDVRVFLFEPVGAPAPEAMAKGSPPKMTPGRAALLGLAKGYLSAAMDISVTLLEVHKLMYFLQVAGEPLRLNFQKAHYGPYADNLRHVLNEMEGHFITGYGDGEDDPFKPLEIVWSVMPEAERVLGESASMQAHFQRVLQLIEGFETPLGMELLATVHWVVAQEQARTLDEVVTRVHQWNDHKKQFTVRHITIGLQELQKQHWLPSPESSAER